MEVFLRHIFFLFLLLLCGTISCSSSSKTAKRGPFKEELTRAQKCNKTTFPVDKNSPVTMDFDVYSKGSSTFLKGNFTVSRDNKNMKIKLKGYIWQNGKWKIIYMIDMGCNSMLLQSIFKALDVKYDTKNCAFKKGVWYFENVEANWIHHMWTSEAHYGRTMWTSEATKGNSTYYCMEFETLISPLNE